MPQSSNDDRSRSSSLSSTPAASSCCTEDEADSSYEPGGLHKVRHGEVLAGRYEVVAKLGWGNFSTVWLCRCIGGGADEVNRESAATQQAKFAAAKIIKSAAKYRDIAADEIKLLTAVRDATLAYGSANPELQEKDHMRCVVGMLDHFEISGLAGAVHPCLIMERLGPNTLELAQQAGGWLPYALLLAATRDALRGLDFLHRLCEILHTDIKPEHIMLRTAGNCDAMDLMRPLEGARKRMKTGDEANSGASACAVGPPCRGRGVARAALRAATFANSSGATFALADLGNGCFAKRHVSDWIQTCEYKSPEVLLGSGYDASADIWSLGCTIFELATGRYLLDPRCTHRRRGLLGTAAVPLEAEHLAQIFELSGPPDEQLLLCGRLTARFLHSRCKLTLGF